MLKLFVDDDLLDFFRRWCACFVGREDLVFVLVGIGLGSFDLMLLLMCLCVEGVRLLFRVGMECGGWGLDWNRPASSLVWPKKPVDFPLSLFLSSHPISSPSRISCLHLPSISSHLSSHFHLVRLSRLILLHPSIHPPPVLHHFDWSFSTLSV